MAGRKLEAADIDAAIRETLNAHVSKVLAWQRNEAGSWGFLAGNAVLACKQHIGRSLTDTERRMVWNVLWQQLQVRAYRM
ncbi:MAG: hypothetical protein EXR67_05600 [Dehalococcoidia bacterium]|nr:hypothetical protein [Dehalococcoidia bacterium]